MKTLKTGMLLLSILATLVGLVWMGQGSGYFRYPAGSFMIDQSPWILRGAIVAIAGVVGIFLSRKL